MAEVPAGPFRYTPGRSARRDGLHLTRHPETGERCLLQVVDRTDTSFTGADWKKSCELHQSLGSSSGSFWVPVLKHGVEGDLIYSAYPEWSRTLAQDLNEGYQAKEGEVRALALALIGGLDQLQRLAGRPHGNLSATSVLFLPSPSGGHDQLKPLLSGLIPVEETEAVRHDHDRRNIGYLLYGYIVGAEADTRHELDFGADWTSRKGFGNKNGWRKFIEELTKGDLDEVPYVELQKRVERQAGGGGKKLAVFAGAGVVLVGASIGVFLVMKPGSSTAVKSPPKTDEIKEVAKNNTTVSVTPVVTPKPPVVTPKTQEVKPQTPEVKPPIQAPPVVVPVVSQPKIEETKPTPVPTTPPPFVSPDWYKELTDNSPKLGFMGVSLVGGADSNQVKTVRGKVNEWWQQEFPEDTRLWAKITRLVRPTSLGFEKGIVNQVLQERARRVSHQAQLEEVYVEQTQIPESLSKSVAELGWQFQPIQEYLTSNALAGVSNSLRKLPGAMTPSLAIQKYQEVLREQAGNLPQASTFAEWKNLPPEERVSAFSNLTNASLWKGDYRSWAKGVASGKLDQNRQLLRELTSEPSAKSIPAGNPFHGEMKRLEEELAGFETQKRQRGVVQDFNPEVSFTPRLTLAKQRLGDFKQRQAEDTELAGLLTTLKASASTDLRKAYSEHKDTPKYKDPTTPLGQFFGHVTAAIAYLDANNPADAKWLPKENYRESLQSLTWSRPLAGNSSVAQHLSDYDKTQSAWSKATNTFEKIKTVTKPELEGLKGLLEGNLLGNKQGLLEMRRKMGDLWSDVLTVEAAKTAANQQQVDTAKGVIAKYDGYRVFGGFTEDLDRRASQLKVAEAAKAQAAKEAAEADAIQQKREGFLAKLSAFEKRVKGFTAESINAAKQALTGIQQLETEYNNLKLNDPKIEERIKIIKNRLNEISNG